MAKIQIIVGTVMGTAQGIAEHLQKHLHQVEAGKHQVSINLRPKLADLTRDENEFLLFCTSNTGNGDLPDNIAPLFVALKTEFPRIAYRKYALINLGDSSYPTFGEAGQQLDEALMDIGAERIGEPLLIDSSVERYPQKLALEWVYTRLDEFS